MDPHTATESELAAIAKQKLEVHWPNTDAQTWLDLLFSHVVEPNLGQHLIVITDFPQAQCALAKLHKDDNGQWVAKRFEVYWKGIELANGYWELTDADEQIQRFEKDNDRRIQAGKKTINPDQTFLAALQHGLPECAGVALGVDRLLMCLLDCNSIDAVMSFREIIDK